jgi:3-hydroxyacyl-CoA dehydrogenase/enoyl-CoA hydratase/3-hydroxybutyryl-CoA epimerase
MTDTVYSVLSARSTQLGPFKDVEAGGGSPAPDSGQWNNWLMARDDNDVAWLLMDKKDSSVNVLSEDVLTELDEVLDRLHQNIPKGLVIRSAKANSFCVGADISEFSKLEREDQVAEKLAQAHATVQKLVDLPCPTVAVIHGQALGGGLELALCCDYRLAVPGATLGTPEIMLGLHPGLGATGRLVELIDPLAAMTMMLTGKPSRDKKARALGLVDKLVEERHLEKAIEAAVAGKLKRSSPSWRSSVFKLAGARQVAGKKMRKQAAKKAPPEHYPAPEALISLWEENGDSTRDMLREEISSFARLLVSDTSRNLVRVFFLREKMKSLATNKNSDEKTEPVKHLHVIGAGAMGGDIAGWCALKGLRVTLFDMEPDVIAEAIGKTTELCKKKHLSSTDTRDVLDRLIPDFHNAGIASADMVLEAVPEKTDIKNKVYAEVEPKLKKGAILATNTSSIPLETLQEGLKDPSRLVGVHFFNPVALMELVEVVQHSKVSDATLARARRFVGQISRLPAPVTSAPGFLVNRALTPYLAEALVLLDEGVAAESIDKVALDFGMPMGPIELADQVGLDICLGVADMLNDRLDTAMPDSPKWLRKKVDKGDLGRKSGKGLYNWKDGKPDKKSDTAAAPNDTLDRLVLPMLNACMACLREEVITDVDVLDGAMIFGTGFAPFRGGPMNYARVRGYDEINSRLESLATQYGDRFKPDEGWKQKSDAS